MPGDSDPRNQPLVRAAAVGLWLLPVYGVLLTLSTLTHQPPVSDFDAYARYVSTDTFLVGHLGASVGGAALGALGAVAVLVYTANGRAGGAAVAGTALTIVANIGLSAAFGSAAFAQPGIGRAHLAGAPGMPALNADTAYGPPLVVTALLSSLLFVVAAIVLGTAAARTHPRLRLAGIGYAVGLALFAVSGFLLPVGQPVAGLVAAAAGVLLARRLPADGSPVTADRPGA
jgi:hypothetical protein